MRETYVSLERPEHSVIAQHLHVQVDQQNLRETLVARQAYQFQGGDYFKIFTFDWNPTALLRRDDVLVDELYIDPDTISDSNPNGSYFRYRLVGRVKDYQYDHQEVSAFSVVGN